MGDAGCRMQDSRGASLSILMELEKGHSNSTEMLQLCLAGIEDPRERRLTTELTLGVLRWRGRLLFLISCFSRRPTEKLDPAVRTILMLGVYQLLYTRIRPHAAIHETANLCRRAKVTSATGFVNGVLRAVLRERGSLPEPQGDAAEVLSIRSSHPEAFARRWIDRFGIDQVTNLLVENNKPPGVFVRVNPLKSDPASVARRLSGEKIRVEPTSFGPEVLLITSGAAQNSRSFADGDFYIQDPASEVLGQQMDPVPGSRVLEIAAAPGGKTFQLALRMKDEGLIVSVDLEAGRMVRWMENMRRLGIRSAHPVVADGRSLPFGGSFDLVVVDAPCSSLGVIRRHPEIKWWRKPEELPGFQKLQLQILDSCANNVRDHGEMIYSVCSFEPEETVEVINRFLAARPEFTELRRLFLFPHVHGTDGFFIARLKKVGVVR